MATDEQKMCPIGRAFPVIAPLGPLGHTGRRPATWVAGLVKRVPFPTHH